MSNSVTIDPANTAAVLDLVKQVEANGGTPPEEKPAQEQKSEGESQESKSESTEKPAGDALESLEIEKQAAPAFTMDSLAEEFAANNGTLTEATKNGLIKALEAGGLDNPAAWIEQFVTGLQYTGAAARDSALALVGGEEGFKAMATWAKASVPEAELAAYNEAVKSKNPHTQKLAVQGMYARFQASGAAPKTPTNSNRVEAGANANAGGIEPVTTNRQVAALVSDPRYATDAAYRAQVDRRIQAGLDAGKRS